MVIPSMTHSTLTASAPLGISGYTFADLHDPDRLASLYHHFCEGVQSEDPAFWHEWDAYLAAPDEPRTPVVVSSLLTRMAPHVSRFVTRLFEVGSSTSAVQSATHDQDDLFRFKVDFVRRRALPLLKGAAHVAVSAEDDAAVARLIASSPGDTSRDSELALARAGCALLERERTDKAGVAADVEALKRWCAARIHDPAYRDWVVFRFPETLDPWDLVNVIRPADILPEQMLGPEGRLRRRDGFKLTDPRMEGARGSQRDSLLRALPRARQGLLLEGAQGAGEGIGREWSAHRRQSARHRAERMPARREDLRDAHAAEGWRRDWRAGARRDRQPDVSRDRPSHLQRLHEVVHLPEAGAGQHPADRDRCADRCAEHALGRRDLRPADAVEPAERPPAVRAAVQRQATCWWSASARPATRWRTTS